MSTAVPVHRGPRQEGSTGADPSPGSPAAVGPSVATERRLRRGSSAPSGGRTSVGAAGPAGHPPVLLLRACQDEVPAVLGGHGGQPDPGVGQNRVVGQYRWRRSRPPRRPQCCPLCCRQCCGQFRRCPARTTMVPDFVRLGFTAATPLPNQGFPARFLVARPAGNQSASFSVYISEATELHASSVRDEDNNCHHHHYRRRWAVSDGLRWEACAG